MNRNWRIETEEGTFALKALVDAAAPVAQRNMEDLSRKAGLDKRRGAVILRHLDNLRKQLRQDLGD